MKNISFGKWLTLADVLLLAIYSALMFLLCPAYDKVFFTAYGFNVFAILAFGIAVFSVVAAPKNLKESFLNEPYFTVSFFYLIAQSVYGIWSLLHGEVAYKYILSGHIILGGGYLLVLILL